MEPGSLNDLFSNLRCASAQAAAAIEPGSHCIPAARSPPAGVLVYLQQPDLDAVRVGVGQRSEQLANLDYLVAELAQSAIAGGNECVSHGWMVVEVRNWGGKTW